MKCVLIVMIGLSIIVLLTIVITWCTGWQIARNVKDMTSYTNQMKLAPSLAKKIKIVEKLSGESRFEEVNRQYLEMKGAKQALTDRIKKIKSGEKVG